MAGAARHSLDSAASVLTVADLIALFDAVEIWRRLAGWPYEVSSWGNVRRIGARRPLRSCDHKGYRRVCLCMHGKKTMEMVNRLVAIVFLGPPPFNGAEALHNDGRRRNNHVGNIRWGTSIENSADQARHGTRPRGAARQNAKLTPAKVLRIDRLYERDRLTFRRIGERLGVCFSVVNSAYHRKTWSDVPKVAA